MGKRVLLAAERVVVAVHRYGQGERHAPHTDTHSRASFLIQGDYREEGPMGAITMRPGHVLLKSRRAKHEDQFGEDGATIVSIEFIRDDPFDAAAPDLWRQRADGFALRHAFAFLELARAGDAGGTERAGVDLVVATAPQPDSGAVAPAWLERLKRELEDVPLAAVDVAAQARSAGAHPAHASRLFRRCYGVSITEHAQAQSVRRAIGALARRDAPLSEIALAAGFCDQSHMSRVFRRVTGRTPGGHRALMALAG